MVLELLLGEGSWLEAPFLGGWWSRLRRESGEGVHRG